ncbi:MAG: DDE-type integrase/transposase/recombinase [Opitutaceae bacterium]
MEEHDEKKALRQRVRELEKALADTHMKGLVERSVLWDRLPATRAGPGGVQKSRHEAIGHASRAGGESTVTISGLCRISGLSRRGYYAGRKERCCKAVEGERVLDAVRCERAIQPRIGTRKLQVVLRREGLTVGRDRLFELLGENDLLVPRKKKAVRTTWYDESLPVYRNQLYELEPTQPNHLWVSDITYVATDEGFVYLALVSDKISRRIVGWNLGETNEASEAIKALQMAIGKLRRIDFRFTTRIEVLSTAVTSTSRCSMHDHCRSA